METLEITNYELRSNRERRINKLNSEQLRITNKNHLPTFHHFTISPFHDFTISPF